MNCQIVQNRLADYLDGTVDPEEASDLEAHLAACSACRAELAAERQSRRVLDALADPPVSDGRLDAMWKRVRSRLEAEMDPASAAETAEAPVASYLSDAPVLVAPPAQRERWLLPVLVAGGVLTVAATVLALSLVWDRSGREPRKEAPLAERGLARPEAERAPDRSRVPSLAPGAHRVMGASGSAGAQAAPDQKVAGRRTALGADSAGQDARPVSMAPPSPTRRFKRARTPGARTASSRRRAVHRRLFAAPRRSRSRPTASGGSNGTSLSALLSSARSARAGGAGGGAAALPHRLSSAEIRRGLLPILGAARACHARYGEKRSLRVRVVVSGATGRPRSVGVLGPLANTPTARCVERAFRRARFPRFSRSSQSFVFPLGP